ncbi:uncharacterized protein [Rutidosis leptorrhynchoides]|uniref:uncharacterized protein n=1 Tax=Rutidosis leptorrhynchoides TaxID=125765 RepID=UPI003A98D8A9
MGSEDIYGYVQVLKDLESYNNVSTDSISSLWRYALLVYQSDQQNRYSKPMPWIGIYIALASLVCVFAMVFDLLHGLQNRKLWFPCKYFTLNAASLTVLAVVVKLPMDLNNIMPGNVDQAAKQESMAFMCTMMANLLPSLATMETKELVSNIIALSVLVITLVVNVCIQINTGVFSYSSGNLFSEIASKINAERSSELIVDKSDSSVTEIIYVVTLLILLIIHICSSLAILKSKQIIESKYQVGHETCLKELNHVLQLQPPNVEKLKQHVRNYWIMAGTGSPQFVTACFATTFASGVISVINLFFQILTMIWVSQTIMEYKSDYKWSMLVILVIQFIGVVVGTIAPVFRCFSALSFKLSTKWVWSHMKVFKVEGFWTKKLTEWKHSSMIFALRSRKFKVVVHNIKTLILSICIGFQIVVVVACKIIGLVPIFFVICVWYCILSWNWLQFIVSDSSITMAQRPEQVENYEDLSCYVLQLQDDLEFAEKTIKGLTKSVNTLFQKAEKRQPINLMKLLEKSRSFEGIIKFDNHLVPPLFVNEEYINSWSLSLVTLTTIAIALPNIQNDIVNKFLIGVSEGLSYVTLVEETLNNTNDYVNLQKAAKTLWLEVEVYNEWLGNKVRKLVSQESSAGQTLLVLKNAAKNMVESINVGTKIHNSSYEAICANSMYHISESILLSYNTNIEEVSQEELFTELSSMISDILAACLTNLPQVIAMKCHTNAIENRETSVHVAAQLLGETRQIICSLQDRDAPNLNINELAFVENWRTYFRHPFP